MKPIKGLLVILILFLGLESTVGQNSTIPICGVQDGTGIIIHETPVDGQILQMYWIIHPALPNAPPILFARTDKLTLYRSIDGGASWANQRNISKNVGSILSIYIQYEELHGNTDVSNSSTIYFLGLSGELWLTKNQGDSYQYINTGYQWSSFLVHPTRSNWILANAYSDKCYDDSKPGDCYNRIFLSQDFGNTWTLIETYVYQFTWGNAGLHGVNENSIWLLDWQEKIGRQSAKSIANLHFRYSINYFHEGYANSTVPLQSIIFMLHYNSNTYLAQLLSDGGLRLLISEDSGHSFNYAVFPFGELHEQQYTILDDTEGSVFMNVLHGNNYWGNLYASDRLGTSYDLSMKYNSRDLYGRTEFRRIYGLEGIYLATQRVLNGSSVANSQTPKQTYMTFDKGGQWRRLSVPVDINNNPIQCGKPSCNLNIHGTWKRDTGVQFDRFGPLYSRFEAIGLVLASGNAGDSLDPNTADIYFSRDGGAQWQKIRNGSFLYEFADHGALILFTDISRPINYLSYTWNQGMSFADCRFTQGVPPTIQNIVVNPKLTSQEFLIQGVRFESNGIVRGVIVHVDFTGFHQKQCGDDDYENFVPIDPLNTKPTCLLGETYVYKRRRRAAACYNGQDYDSLVSKAVCACSRDDFECDFCYEAAPDGSCVLSSTDACSAPNTNPPNNCVGTYTVTKGYRLVPGTKCDPNAPGSVAASYMPTVYKCPTVPKTSAPPITSKTVNGPVTSLPSGGGTSTGVIAAVVILILVLIVAVTAGILFYLVRYKKINLFRNSKINKYFSGTKEREVGHSLLDDY